MQNDSKQINLYIEAVIFRQEDFKNSSSEETIYVLHARTTDFADIHAFWSEAKQIYTYLNVDEYDQPRSISQTEFTRILGERTCWLTPPLPDFILKHGQWVCGMLLTDRWYETLMLVEVEEEYLAFHWDTTA